MRDFPHLVNFPFFIVVFINWCFNYTWKNHSSYSNKNRIIKPKHRIKTIHRYTLNTYFCMESQLIKNNNIGKSLIIQQMTELKGSSPSSSPGFGQKLWTKNSWNKEADSKPFKILVVCLIFSLRTIWNIYIKRKVIRTDWTLKANKYFRKTM